MILHTPRSEPRHPKRQRGAAAVELAILFPVLILLLAFPLFLGRLLCHYTVMQKAAQDAARYLSSIPRAEMRSLQLAPGAADIAEEIVRAELAGVDDFRNPLRISILCGTNTLCYGTPAGTPLPTTVSVTIETEIMNPLFELESVSSDGFSISVTVEVPYAGS